MVADPRRHGVPRQALRRTGSSGEGDRICALTGLRGRPIGGEVMSAPEGEVDGYCPVRWLDHGREAIAALPEHVDLSTASPIREQLLALINRGAKMLIADMTATISCDHAGADILARVHQRAAASGTELRLVVTAPVVRRVLSIRHIDRLISIYPVLEAALAASRTAVVLPLVPRHARTGSAGYKGPDAARPVVQEESQVTAVTPAVLWQALEALPDGVALTDDNDQIALVNRRLEEMFGYEHGELAGRPLRALIPASDTAWVTAIRKNGTAFPAQISLVPVKAKTGRFTLAVIRGSTGLDPDGAAGILDKITRSIFAVGMTLSTTADMSSADLRNRIDEATRLLDDLLNGIYEAAFHGRRPQQADGQ